MSQITSSGTGIVPPTAGVFVLTGNIDVGGGGPTPVPPDGVGNINVVGDNETIQTQDNPATNTLLVVAANTSVGTGTTVDAAPVIIDTIQLGAVPGVYEIEIRIAAHDTTTPSGAGWKIFATVRTTGAAGILIGLNDDMHDAEAAIVTADAICTVNQGGANTFDIVVFGVVGLNINWKSLSAWTFVS